MLSQLTCAISKRYLTYPSASERSVPENSIFSLPMRELRVPPRLEDTTVADFDDMFAINVKAPFFLVQQLSPIMSAGSSIIFTSSLATRTTVGELSPYAASKGAISTLVTHFAAELGARGIRVNAIAPGIVATDMSSFVETKEGREFTLGIQALKRVATPGDIAGVIVFLAGDDAGWVTGDVIRVDGGSKL